MLPEGRPAATRWRQGPKDDGFETRPTLAALPLPEVLQFLPEADDELF